MVRSRSTYDLSRTQVCNPVKEGIFNPCGRREREPRVWAEPRRRLSCRVVSCRAVGARPPASARLLTSSSRPGSELRKTTSRPYTFVCARRKSGCRKSPKNPLAMSASIKKGLAFASSHLALRPHSFVRSLFTSS